MMKLYRPLVMLVVILLTASCDSINTKSNISLAETSTAPLMLSWQGFSMVQASSMRGLDVLDQKTIWVSGNHGFIAKTDDAGERWQVLTIPKTAEMDFRDVEVLSNNEVLLMTAGPSTQSNIYKTNDGGLSWKTVYANRLEAAFFDGFAFWNAKQGILGGDPIDGKLFLLTTMDGGESWARVNPNSLPPMLEGEAGGFAASGSHITAKGNSVWIGTGGRTARVFYSKDKGTTWQVSDTPMIQGEPSQGIFSLDFFDELVGVAVGGDYTKEAEGLSNVILTNDGGATWRLARDFPPYQSSVRYLSKDVLVSTGPAGSYYSKNGGLNWHKIDGLGYHSLAIGENGNIWTSGRDGKIGHLSY